MKEMYNGWEVVSLKNQWVTLFIAPQLGGRLLQLEMDGYTFFFVNPLLQGFTPDETRLGKNGTWLNYGGEKIWVAPQGWNSPEMWPGPPDPVLDGGVFSCDEGVRRLTLTGPYDAHTGLQISRTVTLSEDAAELRITVRFENQSDTPRKWAVWPVCQVHTPEVGTVKVICAINAKSVFPQGYKVVHGLVNNPQFGLNSEGHLAVDYQYLVGKVILDADAGWVAAVNRTNGKVLLMCYDYEPEQQYPDDASVHLWTQGKGMIYSRGRLLEFKDDFAITLPYMEMELVGPLQEILPGRFSEFDYALKTATIPVYSTVTAVNETGVIAEKLTVIKKENSWQISGKYGLFQRGTLRLTLQNSSNLLAELSVSPLEGLEVAVSIDPLEDGNSHRLVLEFWDEKEHMKGVLDETYC